LGFKSYYESSAQGIVKRRGEELTLSLADDLVSCVASKPQGVEMVFIGQAFTAVKLTSGEVGLALTPLSRFDSCIGASRLAGTFTVYNSAELAKFFCSTHPFLRSIGLAAINSVLQGELRARSDFLEGDFLDFLQVKSGDKVATIDYYTTKIEALKKTDLTIFDDRFSGKRKDIPILPLSKLQAKLLEMDVVVLPPAFLDRTEDVRRFASNAREVVLVHPTVPPFPTPFFERGVTMVASMMILNPNSVLKFVMEGAGTTMFKRFCKKIVFRAES